MKAKKYKIISDTEYVHDRCILRWQSMSDYDLMLWFVMESSHLTLNRRFASNGFEEVARRFRLMSSSGKIHSRPLDSSQVTSRASVTRKD